MPFGFFKKKKDKEDELHYDPTSIQVTDLRKGWIVEYDGKTWEVEEEYEYDWGDNYFSYEFKLVCETDTIYLSVEEDDEVDLQVTQKLNFGKLDEEVEEKIRKKGRPPKQIEFNGTTFFRESERPGYFRNVHEDRDWIEFIAWEYYDDSEKFALNIEQYGENEFEASFGIVAETHQFSNILPVQG